MFGECANFGFVEWHSHATVGQQPFVHFEAQRALYQRFVLAEEEIVGVWPIHPTDFIDVAEARCYEKGRAGAGSLEQRVDRYSRAMQKQIDVGKRYPCLFDTLLDPLDQGARSRQ